MRFQRSMAFVIIYGASNIMLLSYVVNFICRLQLGFTWISEFFCFNKDSFGTKTLVQ